MTAGTTPLIDGFGRVASDLRVSVTDRCNLRCTYCMPAEGMTWLPREDLLNAEELERLVAVFVELGVHTVRLTGGEPLVRAGLTDIVRRMAALPIDDLSLTTNGVLLARHAHELAQAGLRRVNVSVDSLMAERFAGITRRDRLADVMEGLRAAERAGLSPIKLNCVVVRGTNDGEVEAFAQFSRDSGFQVRFIEFMPIDAPGEWSNDDVVPAGEIVERVNAVYPLIAAEQRTSAPATSYRFADGAPGGIGVIGSVTAPFCDRCDRLRLSADGVLQTCLFGQDQTDLRTPLRSGASTLELQQLIVQAVKGKWAGHQIGRVNFMRPKRSMSTVGG